MHWNQRLVILHVSAGMSVDTRYIFQTLTNVWSSGDLVNTNASILKGHIPANVRPDIKLTALSVQVLFGPK